MSEEKAICTICNQTYSSTKTLRKHQFKRIPCDLKCRICDLKCSNSKQYSIHIKQKHSEKETNEEEEEDMFPGFQLDPPDEPPKQKTIIPIDDFKHYGEIIRKIIDMAKENGAIGTGPTVVNINFINININNAAEAFRVPDFEYALRCLENPDNIKSIAAAVLAKMHTDPERPEMHTIKMRKDLSRKQVSIFSRPSDDLPAEWLSYGYEAALRKLSDHAAYLLKTALCGSINVFDFKFREEGQKLCVCLSTPIDHKYIIMYDERDDDETGMIYATEGILLKLDLYEGELFDVPVNDKAIKKQKDILFKHIKAKGTHVLQLLKDIKFTGKDLGAFLERTRRPLTMMENID